MPHMIKGFRLRSFLLSSATAILLTLSANAQQATDAIAPESATSPVSHRDAVRAPNWMVTAANPLAVEAGANVLRRGGNAIDAMVAVQTMLGLVEPQSSGLGAVPFWFILMHAAAS